MNEIGSQAKLQQTTLWRRATPFVCISYARAAAVLAWSGLGVFFLLQIKSGLLRALVSLIFGLPVATVAPWLPLVTIGLVKLGIMFHWLKGCLILLAFRLFSVSLFPLFTLASPLGALFPAATSNCGGGSFGWSLDTTLP